MRWAVWRCLPVAFQDRLDEGHERRQAGGGRAVVVLDRDGGGQCLAHQALMNAKLARHPLNGANPKLVFTSDLLEKLHCCFPPSHPVLLPVVCASGGYEVSSQGWAIRNDRTGPNQNIKDTECCNIGGYTACR